MNILMPMAGAGSRFSKAGYTTPKPLIEVTSPRNGKRTPMVVAAIEDIPATADKHIFVMQEKHLASGIGDILSQRFPNTVSISIQELTEGQASTCLLAKDHINNETPLFIAACDNGMLTNKASFAADCEQYDALILTHVGYYSTEETPEAYGWVKTKSSQAIDVSVKVPISDTPLNDHAITGSFWFKKGSDFISCAEAMINNNDRVNGEFYVDQCMNYAIKCGLKVGVHQIRRYLCWGTPADYECYESTYQYWKDFLSNDAHL